MKFATLACLAALCLTGPSALAAPAEPAIAKSAQAVAPTPASAPEPAATPAHATAPRSASVRAERRRRSYAACNRASHQRGLYGGRRRRFLIRCRLGYERTRGPQTQAPAAPSQTGRKP